MEGGVLKGNHDEKERIPVESNLKMAYQELNVDLNKLNNKKKESRTKSKPFKRDYEAMHKLNIITGQKGEAVVIKYEIDRLRKYRELSGRIEQKSSEDDSLGYDVLSFETDGRERFIEVKSTKGKINSNRLDFYLTDNELQTAKSIQNYWLYYVSEVESATPKISPIKNPFATENECINIKPVQYAVNIGVK